jgi:hypothetical protein
MALMTKKRSAGKRIAKKVTGAMSSKPKTVAVAGLAAATAVGAAAWLSTRRNGEGVALHVEADGDGGWLLRREGVEEPIERHPNKKGAVSSARHYAREHGPSMLTIHKESGAVSERHVYAKA